MAVSKTSDLGSQKKVYEIGVGLKRVKNLLPALDL